MVNPTGGIGIYFVNEIRLDLVSHTIVADACIISLSDQSMDKLIRALERLLDTDLGTIETPDNETKLWKLLLPALAE